MRVKSSCRNRSFDTFGISQKPLFDLLLHSSALETTRSQEILVSGTPGICSKWIYRKSRALVGKGTRSQGSKLPGCEASHHWRMAWEAHGFRETSNVTVNSTVHMIKIRPSLRIEFIQCISSQTGRTVAYVYSRVGLRSMTDHPVPSSQIRGNEVIE